MRVDGNHGSTLAYEPNSYGEWQEQKNYAEPPLKIKGDADHWDCAKTMMITTRNRACFSG